MRARRWSVAGAALAISWPGLGLQAQAKAQEPAPAVSTSQPDREPREAIAREIARLALLDLRSAATLTVADFRCAIALLDFAHQLDPSNTDIIRRQIEAAHNAGDQDLVIERTRALVLRDPRDQVAILRLITSTISSDHHTAESRLAAYDRYISDSRLDPAVRSRLALDAALLFRERGEDKEFKDRLVQSTQLDSTHKEAAVLAATFFTERVQDDPAGRIDLLVNVLKADPIDPNVHMALARELVMVGAYESALRFHTNALNISATISPLGEVAQVENSVLQWYARGPAFLVKALNNALAAERDAAARAMRQAEAQKKPTDGIPKPEDVQLPAPLLVLYILAADAAGDPAAAQGGVQDLSKVIDRLVERLRNPRTRGQISDSEATRLALEATVQLNTIRLWTNTDVEKFNESPEALRGIRQNFPDAADLLDALWALRNDRPQETIETCLKAESRRMSRVALGLAYEAQGERNQAVAQYLKVAKEDPFQPSAVWAHQRAVSLGAPSVHPESKSFESLVADPRVPLWIDSMVISPHQYLRVRSSISEQEIDATGFLPIRLTITNQSPIALALGPDRPINSRFLVAPSLERVELGRFTRPEVIDIDRRLRLLPRESIEVDVWPTPGQAGWVIDSVANRSVRLRWKLVQGFVADSRGSYKPGPMCLETESEALLIRPLASSSLGPTELARTILVCPLENLRRLACVTRAHVLQPLLLPDPVVLPAPDAKGRSAPPPPPEPLDLKSVANAFATRYPSLPPATRAMLASVVPHARLSPDMAALDAVVRADLDPLVRCVALSTRVADASDELLATAAESADPRIQAVAESVKQRFTTVARFYATMTPESLTQPGPGAASGGNP